MLKHNCIVRFSFGFGDIQYRHILIADGKVLAFDMDLNNHLFTVTDTLEEMFDKYGHYPKFEVIEADDWQYIINK